MEKFNRVTQVSPSNRQIVRHGGELLGSGNFLKKARIPDKDSVNSSLYWP